MGSGEEWRRKREEGVIFILKVRPINLRRGLKNKFTVPPDINCLDLLGRIASSCFLRKSP